MSTNPAKDAIAAANIVTDATPSPAGSMVGWSFSTWWDKNKAMLKGTISAVAGILTGGLGLIAVPELPPEAGFVAIIGNIAIKLAIVIAAAGISFGSKLLMDMLDYRQTKNPGQDTPSPGNVVAG